MKNFYTIQQRHIYGIIGKWGCPTDEDENPDEPPDQLEI